MPVLDVGTGMTREECTDFNEAVNVGGVRAYWDAVGNSVRETDGTIASGKKLIVGSRERA